MSVSQTLVSTLSLFLTKLLHESFWHSFLTTIFWHYCIGLLYFLKAFLFRSSYCLFIHIYLDWFKNLLAIELKLKIATEIFWRMHFGELLLFTFEPTRAAHTPSAPGQWSRCTVQCRILIFNILVNEIHTYIIFHTECF